MSLRMVGEGEEKSKIILTKFYTPLFMAKIVPAITSLTYVLSNGVSYIDIARDLSRVNRRLYRQGRNYAVESISVTCNSTNMRQSDVLVGAVYSMGNSYAVHNSWKKGFKAWRKQLKKYDTGGLSGRWSDFKIYLDDTMEDGTINNVVAGDGAAVLSGDWHYSKLVFDDDGTEREFCMHMIGSSNLADTNEESGIGLIHEYARSVPRTSAQEPDVSSEAGDTIYAKILGTDELTDMILDNIELENDSAPYDRTEYYGGDTNGDAAHIERFFSVSPMEFTQIFPGCIAPCGLLKFVVEENTLVEGGDANATLTGKSVYESSAAQETMVTVRLVPGPYKGVLAPPMGQ